MARRASGQPTEGELEILKVLWALGPLELGKIRAELEKERPVAASTVATMLSVMLGKKLVRRSDGPRGYLWSARVSRSRAAADLLRRVIDHVFDGSALLVVAHLLKECPLSEEQRVEIRRLLEAHEAGKPPKGKERNR